jgi:hypothetical protein
MVKIIFSLTVSFNVKVSLFSFFNFWPLLCLFSTFGGWFALRCFLRFLCIYFPFLVSSVGVGWSISLAVIWFLLAIILLSLWISVLMVLARESVFRLGYFSSFFFFFLLLLVLLLYFILFHFYRSWFTYTYTYTCIYIYGVAKGVVCGPEGAQLADNCLPTKLRKCHLFLPSPIHACPRHGPWATS